MQIKFTLFLVALFCGFSVQAQTTVTITDADLVGGETYNWTSDNEYVLDGLVFLEEGGVLNIAPGTAIKGASATNISTGDNTSALIIARGAQIFANGTADQAIIFTAQDDDLADAGDFTAQDRGEWGGLIILGSATIARPGGEDGIEGIDADEARARFGGTDNDDNSGIIRYVSIRHGGAQLSTDNEINGLTLGGVGSGTTIDYVEVFANEDDGIEFFGGTVSVFVEMMVLITTTAGAAVVSSGTPCRAPAAVPVAPASTMAPAPTAWPPSACQRSITPLTSESATLRRLPVVMPTAPCRCPFSSATMPVGTTATPSSPTSTGRPSPSKTGTIRTWTATPASRLVTLN
jgi:hypothetical protein